MAKHVLLGAATSVSCCVEMRAGFVVISMTLSLGKWFANAAVMGLHTSFGSRVPPGSPERSALFFQWLVTGSDTYTRAGRAYR